MRHGPLHAEDAECLVVDLGLVLQHIAGVPSAAVGMPHAAIALKARRLLATACDMGWEAVAAAVLPLACAKCSCAAEMVAAIHLSTTAAEGAKSLSLLHRAVRSGSLKLLAGVLAWGDAHGYRWPVDCAGPSGITPLHLSALLPDSRAALLLLDHCGWPAAFTQLRSHDGVTPFHLAFQMGHYQVDTFMCSLSAAQGNGQQLHLVDGAAAANNNNGNNNGPVAAQGSRGRAGRGGPNAAACRNGGGDDDDEEAEEQAAADLEPCEVCHCTLPPLVLSVAASCNDCGRRRHCVGAGACGSHSSACRCGMSRPALKHERGEVCSLSQHSTVYNITALCQGCHANRVMAVA